MSEAADFIADLDEEIRDAGQAVTLIRPVTSGAPITHACQAIVRGYRPDKMDDGLQQGESRVILSPTGLPPAFADANATRLRVNDEIGFDGRERNVEFVDPVRVGDTLVRLNVTVLG